jgi:hypothetical protein
MLARLQASPLKEDLEELKLREINLVIFPDWSQPEELLLFDIEKVFRAIMTHPDRSYMTLLIETSTISKEEANLAISSIIMKLLYEEDFDIVEQPEISLVGNLSKMKWQSLHQQIQIQIKMKYENNLALREVGIENLPSCDISKFSKQRVFQSARGIWQFK